ncbi:DNA/RNA non-specific endonuclease [Actinomyces respiraculi]|uniref:DNA/RNA non-specific endonuclease n=1 Tax=Actinomyces respiraculi TaxID=2744574 RepID=UPI00141E3EA6|nr:DNA/RNA non-specific endonuclease [Actinomyces respiraculi]
MTIIPSEIPGLDIDVESIRTNATDLSSHAGTMRMSGSTLKMTWAGMTSCYQAPEQETLYAAMSPVETTTGALADDLESMASALGTFADTAEVIKTDAQNLRLRAQGFLDTTGKDPEWMYDQGNVDAHNSLVAEANALQVRLWDAERECANTIRALDGTAGYHADQQSRDDQLFYGLSEIPVQATGLDWGDPVDRRDHCFKGVGVSVWRGVYNDSLLGMVNGLAGLFGVKFDGPKGGVHASWDTAAVTWRGIGNLMGLTWDEFGDFDGLSFGTASRARAEMLAGFIAWDMWKEDPVRAGTVTVVNIGVTVATVGVGVAASGAARGGTVAARLGPLGRAAQIANTIMRFTDPVGMALDAGVARLGSWAARITGIRAHAHDLMDAWHNWRRADVPDVDVPTTDSGSHPDVGSVDRAHAPEVDGGDPSMSPDAASARRPAADVDSADAHAPAPRPHADAEGSGTPARRVDGDADVPGASRGREDAGADGDAPEARPGVDADGSGVRAHRVDGEADVPGTSHGRPGTGVDADAPGSRPDAEADGSGTGAHRADDGYSADRDPFNVEHRPSVANSVDIGVDHPLSPTPRKPFGRGADLEPDTVYHVEGRGDFYTNSEGVVVHVEAGSAATNGGRINPDLNDPLPNATYTVDDRFHYTTDEHGRTVRCEVDRLDVPENGGVRKPHIQRKIGHYGDDLPGVYEGGHLIATQYGGPPESINIVPELREVNRGSAASNGGQGSFHTFETENRDLSYSNIEIDIDYDVNYTGTSLDEVPETLYLKAEMQDGSSVERLYRNR